MSSGWTSARDEALGYESDQNRQSSCLPGPDTPADEQLFHPDKELAVGASIILSLS